MVNKFHKLDKAYSLNGEVANQHADLKLTYHKLTLLAVEEVQKYLSSTTEITHDFKLNEAYIGSVSGKMFGVLLCKNEKQEIGYLTAFSGKLGDKNQYDYFVPPVYDILESESFFRKEIQVINEINRKIKELKNKPTIIYQKKELTNRINQLNDSIKQARIELKTAKEKRKEIRPNLSDVEKTALDKQSEIEHITFKQFRKKQEREIQQVNNDLVHIDAERKQLEVKRSQLSHDLQQKIFEQFTFRNSKNEFKSLSELFVQKLYIQPPAGAGECAAPKLLNYAFENKLQPLALVEFWWGQSPKSLNRKHGEFYPYCKEKCEPILAHVLEGINLVLITNKSPEF